MISRAESGKSWCKSPLLSSCLLRSYTNAQGRICRPGPEYATGSAQTFGGHSHKCQGTPARPNACHTYTDCGDTRGQHAQDPPQPWRSNARCQFGGFVVHSCFAVMLAHLRLLLKRGCPEPCCSYTAAEKEEGQAYSEIAANRPARCGSEGHSECFAETCKSCSITLPTVLILSMVIRQATFSSTRSTQSGTTPRSKCHA